ncbi:MAG: hypothetical protein V8T82_11545 [Romboutsia timonensis]
MKINFPSSFKTLCISSKALLGLSIEHNTSVATTVSNDLSSNGSFSAFAVI